MPKIALPYWQQDLMITLFCENVPMKRDSNDFDVVSRDLTII